MSEWKHSNRNQGVPRDFLTGGTAEQPETTIRVRRDAEARRELQAFADGEPFWTSDEKKLYVGDGETLGGIPVGLPAELDPQDIIDHLNTPEKYIVSFFWPSVPLDNQILVAHSFGADVSFPAGLADSSISAVIAPTDDDWTGTIFIDGEAVGTVTIPENTFEGTFSFAEGVSALKKGVLYVVSQATADATIAGIYMTLVGTEQ
jgi:hypothetical protein